ncbi:phosphonate-binding protein [Alkalicaulis satelles]|uniref:Phosphonate-binding protein n=1 Tax=Alkalicaulis satelles TaxID=2609175 RepID=A0A5M6ZH26_9PROT|nr:photosynthetic complex assembly protein PuhC [Alkalicaulis satelles]KAA5804029.1 phosphonate-binding protein [Alkalicaulis satelles]
MSQSRQEIIHQRAVFAMCVLVVATMIIAAFAQWTGAGARYAPGDDPVFSAELLFDDGARGLVTVNNAANGARLIEYGENEGVFVRGVMRTVARQRRMRGLGRETPVRLARFEDGQLWLIDPASGVNIYLNAFGPDNRDAFDDLLERSTASLRAEAAGGQP